MAREAHHGIGLANLGHGLSCGFGLFMGGLGFRAYL